MPPSMDEPRELHAHMDWMVPVARSLVRDVNLAEDVVQEASTLR